MATLVRRALAEVCTVPVLLVYYLTVFTYYNTIHQADYSTGEHIRNHY